MYVQTAYTHRQEHGMDFARMALNEAAARRSQDYDLADYWREEAQRESDRLEREARAAEWDVLKGSPEHG